MSKMTHTERLVIVRRNEFGTFAAMAEAFADEPNVRLIWDRRVRERRWETEPSTPEDRRRGDRRRDPAMTWGNHSYLLLSIADSVEARPPEPIDTGARADAYEGAGARTSEEVRLDIEAAARSDLAVLISGGDAVSRRSLAHRIHRRSDRAGQPLLVVDREAFFDVFVVEGDLSCATRADAVNAGTLLIEEVADLTWDQQSDLALFLEQPAVPAGERHHVAARRARIISGTSHWLLDRVASKQFRADLFYRLNAIHLVMLSGALRTIK